MSWKSVLRLKKESAFLFQVFSKSVSSTQWRASSFAPHFIQPIYKRQELERLKESGEIAKLANYPVKSARSEDTSSQFHDPVVEKFINYVMRCGNKELARELMNKTFETIKRVQVEKYNRTTDPEEKSTIELNALTIFHKAVENCKPVMQLTPIKRGGATYQVPVPVTDRRALFLSMNWLIEAGKAEPKTTRFYIKLANELINASKNQGRTIKKKHDLHKQCEANRAYAHYRWG